MTKVRREPIRCRFRGLKTVQPLKKSRVGGPSMAASSLSEPPFAGVGVAFAAGAEAAPLSRSRCFAVPITQSTCQWIRGDDTFCKRPFRNYLTLSPVKNRSRTLPTQVGTGRPDRSGYSPKYFPNNWLTVGTCYPPPERGVPRLLPKES